MVYHHCWCYHHGYTNHQPPGARPPRHDAFLPSAASLSANLSGHFYLSVSREVRIHHSLQCLMDILMMVDPPIIQGGG